MDWITRNYPKGARIVVPSKRNPKATIGARVIDQYTGANSTLEGIVISDDEGNTYSIEASFLDEDGGGV
jgi:hypothetical protein